MKLLLHQKKKKKKQGRKYAPKISSILIKTDP